MELGVLTAEQVEAMGLIAESNEPEDEELAEAAADETAKDNSTF